MGGSHRDLHCTAYNRCSRGKYASYECKDPRSPVCVALTAAEDALGKVDTSSVGASGLQQKLRAARDKFAGKSQVVCKDCQAAKYQEDNSHLHDVCKDESRCGQGTFLLLGASSSEAKGSCEPCGPNTYQTADKHRKLECMKQDDCEAGKYVPSASALDKAAKGTCEDCPSGRYGMRVRSRAGSNPQWTLR